jgi:hypothetical protein
MTSNLKTLTALAFVSALLTACGGGGGGGGTGSFSSSTSSNLAAAPDAAATPELVAVADTAPAVGANAALANDSDPSTEPGVLTVTEATLPGYDGVYGAPGAVTVTEVYLQQAMGVQPELCAYKFTLPAAGTTPAAAFGKITYRPAAMGLNFSFLTFNGKEYATGDAVDTVVNREQNFVRFTSKTLTATDGSNHTIKLNATIPLHITRNAKC